EEVRAVTAAGADWLHLDIMDGHFVPNISFGPGLIKALRRHTTIPFDVHLMIAPVDAYLQAFADAGADLISLHPEAGAHLHRSLQTIGGLGKKAGVVLNPATPIAAIEHVMDLCDLILVMSVNPGFGGQSFLESQLPKIEKLRRLIEASGRDVRLQVDGGVTAKTAPLCLNAGADVLVAGTAVFGTPDYAEAIKALRGGAA
ncbi:MAG: ribulose-phosphate 3-epimerase, partial [Alphaproteobacteria bacterium]